MSQPQHSMNQELYLTPCSPSRLHKEKRTRVGGYHCVVISFGKVLSKERQNTKLKCQALALKKKQHNYSSVETQQGVRVSSAGLRNSPGARAWLGNTFSGTHYTKRHERQHPTRRSEGYPATYV